MSLGKYIHDISLFKHKPRYLGMPGRSAANPISKIVEGEGLCWATALTAAMKWMREKNSCKVMKYAGTAVLRSVVNTFKTSRFRWAWPKRSAWGLQKKKKNEEDKTGKNREYCSPMHINTSKNIKWDYLSREQNLVMQPFAKGFWWFREQWVQHKLVTWQCC